MRKIMTLFLIILFVFSMAGFASAEPANITEALATANDDLRAKNDNGNYFFAQNEQGKPINEGLWLKSKLFSYGNPQEASPGANDYDKNTNQYRYHGYTMNGEKYTNTFFRNDTTEIVDVNSANWIPFPWEKDNVQNFVTNTMKEPSLDPKNPFNNDPDLLESINRGFENLKDYNPYIKFERTGKQWQEYVHVLQPPTEYTFGMGRLFRLVGVQMRYLTIPLPPLSLLKTEIPDFSVSLEVDRFKNVEPGDKITSTVTYTLNPDHPQPEKAWLRLHHVVSGVEYPITLEPLEPQDTPDPDGFLTFQPGESKTYRYTFTVQDQPSKILARINPVDIDQDQDWSNNRDEAWITTDNLWVEIIDYTKEAQIGGTASVKARIHNDTGELLTTRLVWKVNGVIMKDISNYDLIGSLDDTLTFTMPGDAAIVTVEINPDRDRPSDERSYDDNRDSCTVNPLAVVIPPDKESSSLKISISAPSKVDAFKQWSYTITVTTDYPPPPPPADGEKDPPPPPTITMNMSASGQTADTSVGYQYWNNGYQKIDPVKKTDQKVFSAGWGKNPHTFKYTYPATGLWGKPVTVTIKADATSSKGQSARDSATVTINPWPIPNQELQLTY
ncbi:Athe_2463 domain-containing protein [Desulforamulus ruminis]|uniref:CARDB domain-containing protein n=1 Tax=Desulforamulus ruminis (strain ATCC 23193 / DSM 2154 / NCIMB 8452 / DL) TaxID=696281 RepID=F6DQ31_DESRL|nr:hypothetical protein [Desulforamulus ruminis]AEG61975.1 hypothetical protein Desru_3775 [Desulforamulus ruminis DSM 2154]